eukprot:CAMPEP_0203748256 /NCGR_PEP_ID=MMETSP0098-20131031/3184_1 /ASSEMBLY_ACC=CAM_ASM_000208 /TAXON_ID=96639 /ORGANISM=" , Strain NY0313808BC1" /LENGTH=175 /DNA_ID=CAMNT_0050636935 /DNA_START=111 /DNA_END=634 /DNA_ORIENTATION=+
MKVSLVSSICASIVAIATSGEVATLTELVRNDSIEHRELSGDYWTKYGAYMKGPVEYVQGSRIKCRAKKYSKTARHGKNVPWAWCWRLGSVKKEFPGRASDHYKTVRYRSKRSCARGAPFEGFRATAGADGQIHISVRECPSGPTPKPSTRKPTPKPSTRKPTPKPSTRKPTPKP